MLLGLGAVRGDQKKLLLLSEVLLDFEDGDVQKW